MYGATSGRMQRSANGISNRQRQRTAHQAIETGAKVSFLLVSVLAQSGGEVEVTKGTLDQVRENLRDLGFSTADKDGGMVVKLLEGGEKERYYTSEELKTMTGAPVAIDSGRGVLADHDEA